MCFSENVDFSKASGSSAIDGIGVFDKLANSLTYLSFICSKKIDLSLNAKLVTSSDARLSVLTLAHEEWKLRVGSLHSLVIIANK